MNLEITKTKTKRKRKLDPNIIRVGDKVKIITPEMFVRCGYPLCVRDMAEEVEKIFGDRIRDLMYSVGFDEFKKYEEIIRIKPANKENRNYNKIVMELARIRLSKKKFGGDKRSVHTKFVEEMKGKELFVKDTQIVKGGIYNKGWSSTDYWSGEVDYMPNYLSDQKTHKILTVSDYKDEILPYGYRYEDYDRIEAIHVEKIQEEAENKINKITP